MTKIENVEITIPEEMVHTLLEVTDLYFRLSMGQFNRFLDIEQFNHLSFEQKDAAEIKLKELKNILFPDLNVGVGSAYYGISDERVSEKAKQMCSLNQVLRHDLAWFKNPDGNKWSVVYDTPTNYSKSTTLPEMKIKTK